MAFRTYHRRKRSWKKGLLSVQFAGVSLFVAMLVVVNMQFNKIRITDHGYNVENVYFGYVSGMDPHRIETLLHELKSLPEVENAGLGFELPVGSWPSGNNVISPDGERELFNVADFYYVDDAYFPILGIPVVEGSPFFEVNSMTGDILISRKFADILVLSNGWNDGIPGLVGAWFFATKWMEGFLVQISLKWWIFALTGAAVLVMTGMAALNELIRAANANPVEALRYE